MDLRRLGLRLRTLSLFCCTRWRAAWWLWLRFSARRLVSNPHRLGIVLVSVALATALASAVLRVSVASIDSFERSISGGDHPYHLIISPFGGRLDRNGLAPCLEALSSRADILGIRREVGIVRFGSASVPVRIAGLAGFGNSSLSASEVSLDSGVITPELADKLGVLESALVTIEVAQQLTQVSVRRANQKQRLVGYADLVVPLSDLPQETTLDSVALRLHDISAPELPRQITGGLEQWLSSCMLSGPPTRVEPVNVMIERGAQLLKAYRFNISVMTLITLVVCGILISQATQIAVYGIVRELAIIRTLGVSQNACLALVVFEATFICFVGAIIGITGAAPLVVWISGFLTSTASEIYNVSLQASSPSIAWGAVAAVLVMTTVGASSAAIGARSVARLVPYRGTRREYRAVRPLQRSVVVTCVTLVSLALACSVLILVMRPSSLIAYSVIFLVLVWASAVLALLLYVAPLVAQGNSLYLCARLAIGAISTSARNFVLSGIAATVSISLLIGLSLMVTSFRETLTRWSAIRLAGDIFVSSAVSGSGNEARLPPQLVERISKLAGVKRVIPYFETTASMKDQRPPRNLCKGVESEESRSPGWRPQARNCLEQRVITPRSARDEAWSELVSPHEQLGVPGGLDHSMVIGGVDLHTQCERRVYSFISGQCISTTDSWSGQAIISEGAARKLAVQVGAQVTVAGASYTVRGTFQEFGTEQPLIVIDRADFEAQYRDHHPETITVDLFRIDDRAAIIALIQQLAPLTTIVRDQRELFNLVEALFNRTFRVTDSVGVIVFIMALLGLLSTTAQYIWERRRELKVAHVVGVARQTLVASLTLEVAAVAVLAALGGVVAGIIIGWCLTSYVNPLVFGWGLIFSVSAKPLIGALLFVGSVTVAMYLLAQIMVKRIIKSVSIGDE